MLKDIFQKIWDQQNGGLDQYQLRDKAFNAIDRAQYGDALYDALLNDAYSFILSKRGERPAARTATDTGVIPDRGSSAGVSVSAARKAQAAGQGNASRSSKLKLIRERWPMLRCSYSVGNTLPRKNLESMSAEDCRKAAQINRTLSDGNIRRAEWLEHISDELIQRNVRVVAKLPTSVLDEIQQSDPKQIPKP